LKAVTAVTDKARRAMPIAARSQKGGVVFVGKHQALEDQLTTWVPWSGKSPDRLDALVWAAIELLQIPQTTRYDLTNLAPA
jgi:phage terminase large subunit-like protein